jgi:hypothetical protein
MDQQLDAARYFCQSRFNFGSQLDLEICYPVASANLILRDPILY